MWLLGRMIWKLEICNSGGLVVGDFMEVTGGPLLYSVTAFTTGVGQVQSDNMWLVDEVIKSIPLSRRHVPVQHRVLPTPEVLSYSSS